MTTQPIPQTPLEPAVAPRTTARPPRSGLGLLASMLAHLGVVMLTILAYVLVRFGPAALDPPDAPAEEAPRPELVAHLEGGSSSVIGPEIHSFGPDEPLRLWLRYDGAADPPPRAFARVHPRSIDPKRRYSAPEIYLALDLRPAPSSPRVLQRRGPASQLVPLAPGLWRLSVMLDDRPECEPEHGHSCAQTDLWLHLRRA